MKHGRGRHLKSLWPDGRHYCIRAFCLVLPQQQSMAAVLCSSSGRHRHHARLRSRSVHVAELRPSTARIQVRGGPSC